MCKSCGKPPQEVQDEAVDAYLSTHPTAQDVRGLSRNEVDVTDGQQEIDLKPGCGSRPFSWNERYHSTFEDEEFVEEVRKAFKRSYLRKYPNWSMSIMHGKTVMKDVTGTEFSNLFNKVTLEFHGNLETGQPNKKRRKASPDK